MKKTDFIDVIALAGGTSKKDAARILASVATSMRVAMIKDKRVVLPGIGAITVKALPARDGRNPRTGDKIQIAAGHKFGFSAAKELREAI